MAKKSNGYIKLFQVALKEYNKENNTSLSMDEFLRILNYGEEDIRRYWFAHRSTKKKKQRLACPEYQK